MSYVLKYHEDIYKVDIPKIAKLDKLLIKTAIEARLLVDPLSYSKPLRRSLRGYRKLRVGDYRIIFGFDGKIIKVLKIGNRKTVYENVDKRFI